MLTNPTQSGDMASNFFTLDKKSLTEKERKFIADMKDSWNISYVRSDAVDRFHTQSSWVIGLLAYER